MSCVTWENACCALERSPDSTSWPNVCISCRNWLEGLVLELDALPVVEAVLGVEFDEVELAAVLLVELVLLVDPVVLKLETLANSDCSAELLLVDEWA